MNQVYPDVALVNNMKRIVAADVHYHLYTNNYAVDRATTLGSLTEMTGGTGYATRLVLGADFTLSGVTSHLGNLSAPDISWVDTGGVGWDVYGYYVTDTTDTFLLACGTFDGGPIHVTAINPCVVTPKFADSSRFSS